jgi:pimeloyl-ACP methyl ester carboxylesterase
MTGLEELRHGTFEGDGVTLHFVEAGRGPLLVLLHGFPEFWYGFRSQIPALASAGFHVVALDLRGYNLSAKPRGLAAYAMVHLVDDVARLIRHLGAERANVVGHDWGGGVAWAFAMQHPELLARLAILNSPHPERFLRGLRRPRQLLRSWYFFFFQLPKLPEFLLARRRYELLLRSISAGLPESAALDAADVARYVEAYAQPGALRAMLDYYRAMLRRRGRVGLRRIDAEVLILWGTADPYLGAELAEPAPAWVPNARLERFEGAGHFIQHEHAERVNSRLIEFFSPPLPGRAS